MLLALDGTGAAQIALLVGVSQPTVRLWLRRFASGGADALSHDAPGRGRHPALDYDGVMRRLRDADLVDANGQPRRVREAAQLLGVSPSTLWRMLRKRNGAS